jgi:hypothetical protein
MKTIKEFYGDSEGPLGFPMRSDAAKNVAQIIAGLPSDCKELIADGPLRSVKLATAMDFSEGERADISFVTTDSVDRDGEVMMSKGGNWSEFTRNPIVTFAHKYDQLPVGRSLWLKHEERNGRTGWLAKTAYIERPTDWPAAAPWTPDAIWHYVRNRFLPGKSIGFIPQLVHAPTTKEIEARPEMAKVRRIIDKWLVLEYAIAPVQSNPDALVMATAKARKEGMLISEALLADFGLIIPEDVPGFKVQTKPKPSAGEPEKDFLKRCIPMVMGEGHDASQAAAMCHSIFSDSKVLDPASVMTLTKLRAQLKQELNGIDVSALVRDTIERARGRV